MARHPAGTAIRCAACGGVFARLRLPTGDGDPLDGERFEWPDGSPCVDGQEMRCRGCQYLARTIYDGPDGKPVAR